MQNSSNPSQQNLSSGFVVWGWIAVAVLGWVAIVVRGPAHWTSLGGFFIAIAIIGTTLAVLAYQTWRLRRWFRPVDWRAAAPAIFAAVVGVVGLWAIGWSWWRAFLVALWGAWALAAVPQVAQALRARGAAAPSE